MRGCGRLNTKVQLCHFSKYFVQMAPMDSPMFQF